MDLKDIEQLAAQKESEWRSISSLQIKTLQNELQDKTQSFNDLQTKFHKLKEDFKYNLKLLQERDNELNKLDGIRQNLKIGETKFLSKISDLRITIDNLKQKLIYEKQTRDEMEMHYKQRLTDQMTQFEIFRTSKNNELEETSSELGKLKLQFKRKVHQLEAEIEAQKVELVHEFEDLLKRKESEANEIESALRGKCLNLEMKNKILSKELEYCTQKQEEHMQGMEEGKKEKEELINKLKQAEFDVSDVSSLKNARILELESQVQHLQDAAHKQGEEFEKRRIQLDKDMRCKQANLLATKQAQLDREKNFEDQIRKLHTDLETCQMETKRALWDANDTKTQLQSEVENKQREIDDLKSKLETIVCDQSHSVVAKDTEIMTLNKRCNILKADNARMKTDIDKYQQDLAKSVTREQSLERAKAQIQLDWKSKCEEIESKAYSQSEEYTEGLRKARDVALADLERSENKLKTCKQESSNVSSNLKTALEVLKRHHLVAEYEKGASDLGVLLDETQENLEAQNEQLREVIKQMRVEMQQLLDERADTSHSTIASERPSKKAAEEKRDLGPYVKSLENEIMEVKKQKRDLEEKLQALKDAPPSPVKVPVSASHPTVQVHVDSLNKNIATLESEKIDLRAQVQKTQASLEHQMALTHRHQQEEKSLATRLRQMEFESTAMKQRDEQETKQLKDQISDLQLQLSESRREADEYYKGGVKNNLRAMELSGKISQMTMDMASNTPWIASPVQGKLVRDLRDEVTELRKKLALTKQQLVLMSDGKPADEAALELMRNQLAGARQRISLLAEERHQLLESSNRMRMEFRKLTDELEEKKNEPTKLQKPESPAKPPPGDSPEPSKLQQMEDLQYQLTKQELAFARHRPLPHHSKSTSSEAEESSVSVENKAQEEETSVKRPISISTPKEVRPSPIPATSSSFDDASLREVWQMLDYAPSSPSVAGEPTVSDPKPVVAPAPRIQRPSKLTHGGAAASRSKSVSGKVKTKPKIRNYNVKDDAAFQGVARAPKR